MQNALGLQSLETLRENTKTSTKLTELAQKDNQLMLKLTAEAQRDARTLKTITLLTMAYLPASFVSVSYQAPHSAGDRLAD